MWLGALLMTIAGCVSLTARRLRIGAPSGKRRPAMQPAE
jgi:cytochrome c-type biogenesis protein CcmF